MRGVRGYWRESPLFRWNNDKMNNNKNAEDESSDQREEEIFYTNAFGKYPVPKTCPYQSR
jgi:hypothetical protein